ncbi:hypothetical protein ACLBR5_09590 [Escherichia coli]
MLPTISRPSYRVTGRRRQRASRCTGARRHHCLYAQRAGWRGEQSYGLAVAALAGVPKEVIKRARQKLRELESISPNAAATQVDGTQMSLLSVPEETSPAVEALENLDPDSLTPRQALEWIYRLKSLV